MTSSGDTEFPRTIGQPATRALSANGYTTFRDLTSASARDLLALHGVGPKAIRILEEKLATRGMKLAD